jgi:uncharacterized protein YidB (DUF937 family)
MGFFDEIESVVGQVAGGAAGPASAASAASESTAAPVAGVPAGASPALMQEAMKLLTDNSSGGLGGLAQQFEQQGLGHLMSSWVGQGPNQPVTGAQLQGVLGDQRLQQLAQKIGLPPDAAAGALAAVLPTLVDRMTPNGTLEHQLLQDGVSWLEGRLTT